MRSMKRALLTLPEVVAITGVSKSQLRREMRRGRLKSCRICGRRRFVVTDVESFLGVAVV